MCTQALPLCPACTMLHTICNEGALKRFPLMQAQAEIPVVNVWVPVFTRMGHSCDNWERKAIARGGVLRKRKRKNRLCVSVSERWTLLHRCLDCHQACHTPSICWRSFREVPRPLIAQRTIPRQRKLRSCERSLITSFLF